MFGNLDDIQKKLKDQLDSVIIEESVENGLIKITASGSKEIKGITIDPSLLNTEDAEQLEDLLLVGINRAMQKADEEAAAVTQNMMSGLMPPGMDLSNLFG